MDLFHGPVFFFDDFAAIPFNQFLNSFSEATSENKFKISYVDKPVAECVFLVSQLQQF